MAAGMTDKESLMVTMRQARERRRIDGRMRELAAKGLRDPSQLTPAETEELCGSVLRNTEWRGSW